MYIDLKVIEINIEFKYGFPTKLHRYGSYFVFTRLPF